VAEQFADEMEAYRRRMTAQIPLVGKEVRNG
jgi:hypothetical protein